MSQSHEMRLLLADDQAGATNAIALAVMGTDLIGDREFGRDPGKRGTRQQFNCGARVLREVVSGGFELQPSAAELDWFLERGFGDNISGYPTAAATPGETLPQFYAFVDKGPEIFRYDLNVVSRLAFSIREGDYLKLRVDLVGSAETSGVSWPGTPPTIACASEFICADVTFELGGTEFQFKSLDLVIDNAIADGQFENAINRTIFESEDLNITVDGTFGYRTDTTALYRRAIAGDAGVITISDGTDTYTIDLANLKIPGKGPTVPASGEIVQVPSMRAYRTAAEPQIKFTKS